MTFETEKYELIKNAVSQETCKVLAEAFRINRDVIKYIFPNESHEDTLVKSNAFSWYSPIFFESLSTTIIKPAVENIVGEELWPTYSYARIYYNGAKMPRHVDRSASEYSVTMCVSVDQNHKWNIGVKTIHGENIYIDQSPGDIVIYKGNELEHWRDSYTGTEQINAFFFYVRKNGNRAELKYDTRPHLGLPTNTRQFDSEEQFQKFRN